MTPGLLARKVLGDRWFAVAGRIYRGLFVDLDRVSDSFPPLHGGQRILDIGGGDGEFMNVLLSRHRDARVTMIDLSRRVGASLTAEVRGRVEVLPATSVRDYVAQGRPRPDVVIIADVVHHIPVDGRAQFFADVRDLFGDRTGTLLIKDVEPGSWTATAAWWCDRYISGDRTVTMIGKAEMTALITGAFPDATIRETDLHARNPPNYSLVVTTHADR